MKDKPRVFWISGDRRVTFNAELENSATTGILDFDVHYAAKVGITVAIVQGDFPDLFQRLKDTGWGEVVLTG